LGAFGDSIIQSGSIGFGWQISRFPDRPQALPDALLHILSRQQSGFGCFIHGLQARQSLKTRDGLLLIL